MSREASPPLGKQRAERIGPVNWNFRVSCFVMAKKKKAKNPNAVALGRLGGLKGGKARIAQLTAEERRELARKAVQARWAKQKARKLEP